MATIPVAHYKNKQIIKVNTGYVIKGSSKVYKTLTAATDSIE